MNERNTERYRMAERGLEAYTEYVRKPMDLNREDPDSILPFEQLPKVDKAVVSDYGIRTMLQENFDEALRMTIDGWIDDNLALVRPWGFDPSAITVPVWMWHGTADRNSPFAHSRWLEKEIAGSELHEGRGRSHLSAVEEVPRALRWAAAGLG
jgi:pimeloyl-ACP methyl ester carboxylesterase